MLSLYHFGARVPIFRGAWPMAGQGCSPAGTTLYCPAVTSRFPGPGAGSRSTIKEQNMEIANNVAVVTGGASGLGRATVGAFVARGGRAQLHDRGAARDAEVAAAL